MRQDHRSQNALRGGHIKKKTIWTNGRHLDQRENWEVVLETIGHSHAIEFGKNVNGKYWDMPIYITT